MPIGQFGANGADIGNFYISTNGNIVVGTTTTATISADYLYNPPIRYSNGFNNGISSQDGEIIFRDSKGNEIIIGGNYNDGFYIKKNTLPFVDGKQFLLDFGNT